MLGLGWGLDEVCGGDGADCKVGFFFFFFFFFVHNVFLVKKENISFPKSLFLSMTPRRPRTNKSTELSRWS